MWNDFQTGQYPVKQVIVVGLDSVSSKVYMGLWHSKFGVGDILYHLRKEVNAINHSQESADCDDLELLMATQNPLVFCCWTMTRAQAIVPLYEARRGWPLGSIRVYQGSLPYYCTRPDSVLGEFDIL